MGQVEKWLGWQSTRESPSPSVSTRCIHDDALAVLAGSKPAAIISADGTSVTDEIVAQAARLGFEVVSTSGCFPTDQAMAIVLGKKQNVDAIVAVIDDARERGGALTLNEHETLGRMLGYHPDAVDDFLGAVRARQRQERRREVERLLDWADAGNPRGVSWWS